MSLSFSTVTTAVTPSYSVSVSCREICAGVCKEATLRIRKQGCSVKGDAAHFLPSQAHPTPLIFGRSLASFPLLLSGFPHCYLACVLARHSAFRSSWSATSVAVCHLTCSGLNLSVPQRFGFVDAGLLVVEQRKTRDKHAIVL